MQKISIAQAKSLDALLKTIGENNSIINTHILLSRISLRDILSKEKEILNDIIERHAERVDGVIQRTSDGGVLFGQKSTQANAEYIDGIGLLLDCNVHLIPHNMLMQCVEDGVITANIAYQLIDLGATS